MEQNKKLRVEDAERLSAEQLQWEEPAGRTVVDAADDLRKDWQLNGTGPYADPTALGKLKALAEAAEKGGQHIYTNPRDSNKHADNEAWHQAAEPEVFLSLIALVSQQAARIAELESDLSEARTGWEGAAQAVREATDEGAEILNNLIASIEEHGNYSKEATLTFLGQLKYCFNNMQEGK